MIKFSDLKLDPNVLKAISETGYETPTPIQAGAIPPALEGRDVLGIAQTGTGKTAGFTLPMITLLGRGRARARMPRSLVLAPTRELAAQVAENFDTYSKHTRLTKALLIGGVSFGEQDKLIDRGVDVLIATPGRLLDHFERGKLLLTGVQIMVVDEADRMLDMGFIPDIERIFQLTPFTRQTLFFSATMAPEIERITDTFLHSPVRIEVARQATTSETITQRLVEITPTRKDQTAKQKRELLRALIDAEGDALTNAIVFCNRKTDVDIVAKSLKAHGYDAAPIHGDLDQNQRTRTLDEFRDGKLRFLIASDVAARGLDIPAVSHVFNFDLPSHAEDYVHRIGRTGRAGRTGTAISIATPNDDKLLAAIESLVKQTLPRTPHPENFSISAAAQNAPRSTSRPDRGERSHDRRRAGRRDNQGSNHHDSKDTRMPHDPPQAVASASRPSPQQTGQQHAVETRTETRPVAVQDTHHRDQRTEPRRDHRRDDHRRGSDHATVGMGDHVPDFLTRSFRPGFTTTITSDSDDAQIAENTADSAQVAASTDEPAVEPKPETAARTSTRSRRSSRTKSVPPATTTPDSSAEAPTPTSAPVQAEADKPAEPEAVPPASPAPAEVTVDSPANDMPAPVVADTPPPADTAPAEAPATTEPADTASNGASEAATEVSPEPAPKPARKRATRTTTKAASSPPSSGDEAEEKEPPVKAPARRRTTRKAAPKTDATSEIAPSDAESTKAAPGDSSGTED